MNMQVPPALGAIGPPPRPAEDRLLGWIGRLFRVAALAGLGICFPAPPESSFTTEGDINVKVTPLEKLTQQYRERRTNESEAEDSRYQLFFRFNRVA